jgi:hypothetical protein
MGVKFDLKPARAYRNLHLTVSETKANIAGRFVLALLDAARS